MTKTYIEIGGVEYDPEVVNHPSDRLFRSAWSTDGTSISVNMVKAKDIWRDKIRQAREEVLEKLDKDYMRALETGADTSQIVADKQALRDAPAHPAIDAATTTEELKLVQPIPNVTVE